MMSLCVFQTAQAVLDKRNREVAHYQQLLTEIEVWLTSTREFIVTETELTTEEQVTTGINKFKRVREELHEKEAQLVELTKLCDDRSAEVS